MKNLVMLLAFIVLSYTSYSQVESYARITQSGNVEADINIYGEKKISNKINFTYFALIEKKYAEGYIGVLYSPKDWISLGLSVGIEQNPALYRLAGTIWTGKGKNSLLILWEKGDGNDNYWYKITASHKFSDKFSLGARAWRFHGVGPVGTYTIPKLETSIFLMPTRDFEFKVNRLIVGFAVKI